ncbi:hypothetical protein DM992_40080 (plasmid) [Burkholderia sp. JP2-270]|nr:hypothetical protein DM992_40080 [Burkholderia sp. JP2-270]
MDDDTRRQPQPMPAPTRDTTTLRLVRTGGGAAHVWDDVSGRAAGRYTTVLVRDARQERAMASYNGEER